MNPLAEQAQFIGQVAVEAAEESDAIMRNPEILDVLAELSANDELPVAFGPNGHDPVAFVRALADGLSPYRTTELDDSPELVHGLALLAWTLGQDRTGPAA